MEMPKRYQCPICDDWNAKVSEASGRKVQVRCKRCGTYSLTTATRKILSAIAFPRIDTPSAAAEPEDGFDRSMSKLRKKWSPDSELLLGLAACTRQGSEIGRPVKVTRDNWKELASRHLKTSLRERSFKLLEALERMSESLDHYSDLLPPTDLTLVDARTTGEFRYLIDYLLKSNLIEQFRHDPKVQGREDKLMVRLTPAGWEAIGPLGRSQIVRGRVFVARSFNDELDDAYKDGIEAGILDAECEPRDLKAMVHTEFINNKILSEIAQAQFVVADMTFCSHGAYFEAGYAKALGRDVVFTCHEDHWDHIHFDTAQYPHIKWKTPTDLREQLRDWLLALKGQAA